MYYRPVVKRNQWQLDVTHLVTRNGWRLSDSGSANVADAALQNAPIERFFRTAKEELFSQYNPRDTGEAFGVRISKPFRVSEANNRVGGPGIGGTLQLSSFDRKFRLNP